MPLLLTLHTEALHDVRVRLRQVWGWAMAVSLPFASCACTDNDGSQASASTLTEATVPTPAVTATTLDYDPYEPRSCEGVPSKSPSTYHPKSGTYAAYLTEIDVEHRRLSFDVIQLLGGEEATAAYRADTGAVDGPPNDTYVVNSSRRVYTANVTRDVTVELLRLETDGIGNVSPGTFEELPEYLRNSKPPDEPWLSYSAFWLTMNDGSVTTICEQYRP